MNYKASIFKDVRDTTPKDFEINKWLQYTIDPPKRLLKLVNKYRETFDKNDKANVPCITMSGRFKDHRSIDNLDQSLPFIVIDIDRYASNKKKTCNTCVDMLLVKEFFMELPFTYYCGYSLSGDGIYGVFLLAETGKLDKYFDWFLKKFQRIGINIDESCKDVSRLRFFSHDSEAYFNPDAKPLMVKDKQVSKPKKAKTYDYKAAKTNQQKVENVINVIQRTSLDITSVYEDWVKIGGALYNEFGEAGRDYFHAVSKFHPDYEFKSCDQKFSQCKKMNKVSLASFFKVATDYGARY